MSNMYDLELDTDVIHESGSTYRSLLEQNQIDLFSDERFDQKENEKLQLKENENNIVKGLFLDKTGTVTDDFTYNELLFLQPMVIEKKQNYGTEEKESFALVMVGSSVLLVIFLLVMTRYYKQRKQREEHDES